MEQQARIDEMFELYDHEFLDDEGEAELAAKRASQKQQTDATDGS